MTTLLTWKQRNAAAAEAGHYTKEDKELVSHWPSCALGERANGSIGEPASDMGETVRRFASIETAMDMGHRFEAAVRHDDVPGALREYRRIRRLKMKAKVAPQ